jgi:hypothetical protein
MIFKDAYSLEFLGLSDTHDESDLHGALIRNLGRFLTERCGGGRRDAGGAEFVPQAARLLSGTVRRTLLDAKRGLRNESNQQREWQPGDPECVPQASCLLGGAEQPTRRTRHES